MFFGSGCVDPAFVDPMLQRPAPEREGAVGYGRYEHVVDALDKALTPGPYLLGEHFTAADLYIGSQIGFGAMMKMLDLRPAFQTYLARVTARPQSAPSSRVRRWLPKRRPQADPSGRCPLAPGRSGGGRGRPAGCGRRRVAPTRCCVADDHRSIAGGGEFAPETRR